MENNFWDRVKALIKEKGLTQAQFAEQNGYAVNTFVGWISKNRSPDLDIAVNIAKQLGTTVEYLVTGEIAGLSQEDIELLKDFHSASEVFQQSILNLLQQVKEYK